MEMQGEEKKERKKGSTLHTRGSGLLNARLNLNSEHVKAFRGFAGESKGERPIDGRRRGKKNGQNPRQMESHADICEAK